MSSFLPRFPAKPVDPTCFGAGPDATVDMCRVCKVQTRCAAAKSYWSNFKSLREGLRLGWEEATKIGTADDSKHVYEVEWRRVFAGTVTNAERVLSDQLLNPFTDMALASISAACALRKVPLWLFIRAQMDVVKELVNARGIPFDVRQLESKQRWDRYEKYRAVLDRNGPVEHSSTTDMNSEWIRCTTHAALDEAEIGRLIVDDRIAGGKLLRSDAIKAVAPGAEWRSILGGLKDRANAQNAFGVHLLDTAYTLARLEAACAVTSCYWPGLPDRIGVRHTFSWDDIARLVISLFTPVTATRAKLDPKQFNTWRPDARNADQV